MKWRESDEKRTSTPTNNRINKKPIDVHTSFTCLPVPVLLP